MQQKFLILWQSVLQTECCKNVFLGSYHLRCLCFCHNHNVDSTELKVQTWVYPYWHNIHSKCHTSPFIWVKGETPSLKDSTITLYFFLKWRSGQQTKHLHKVMVLLGRTHTLMYETVNIFLFRGHCYEFCMNICFSWLTQQESIIILYHMLVTSWWIASKQVQRHICHLVVMLLSCFLPAALIVTQKYTYAHNLAMLEYKIWK